MSIVIVFPLLLYFQGQGSLPFRYVHSLFKDTGVESSGQVREMLNGILPKILPEAFDYFQVQQLRTEPLLV